MESISLGKDQMWREKKKSESQKIVGLESLMWKKSAKVIVVNTLQDAQGKKKSNENLLRFIEERQQNNQKNENDKKKWKSQRVGNER